MLKCFYTKQTKVALSKKVASKPVSRTYEEEGESQGYNNIICNFSLFSSHCKYTVRNKP